MQSEFYLLLRTALLFVALLLGGETIAEAQRSLNSLLIGDYALTDTRGCVSASGFGVGLELLGSADTDTNAAHAILTFNGDGTGIITGRSLQINHSLTASGNIPVSQSEFTCGVTYTVNPDGSFTLDLVDCNGTTIAGRGTGLTFTLTGIHFDGLITQRGRTLILSDVNPNVEDVSVTLGGGSTFQFKRICHRSGKADKIQ